MNCPDCGAFMTYVPNWGWVCYNCGGAKRGKVGRWIKSRIAQGR